MLQDWWHVHWNQEEASAEEHEYLTLSQISPSGKKNETKTKNKTATVGVIRFIQKPIWSKAGSHVTSQSLQMVEDAGQQMLDSNAEDRCSFPVSTNTDLHQNQLDGYQTLIKWMFLLPWQQSLISYCRFNQVDILPQIMMFLLNASEAFLCLNQRKHWQYW